MCPVQLRLQHRCPDSDRSRVISLGSDGRSQEDRRWLRSLERLGGGCISKRVAFPVCQRQQRRLGPLAVGRHPAGGDLSPTAERRSRGPEILMGGERGRGQDRQSEESTVDIHGISNNEEWAASPGQRLQCGVELGSLRRLDARHWARGGRSQAAEMRGSCCTCEPWRARPAGCPIGPCSLRGPTLRAEQRQGSRDGGH